MWHTLNKVILFIQYCAWHILNVYKKLWSIAIIFFSLSMISTTTHGQVLFDLAELVASLLLWPFLPMTLHFPNLPCSLLHLSNAHLFFVWFLPVLMPMIRQCCTSSAYCCKYAYLIPTALNEGQVCKVYYISHDFLVV